MPDKDKKFYITTSIAYTNAMPHIGFALESLQADVLARYNRNLGKDTFFLTGTDEHGAKIAKAAEEQGKDPKTFTDEISSKFKALKKALNLSNDSFIRTTDRKRHWPAVKKVWEKINNNGDIYKKEYNGLYCIGCEAFITKKDLVDGKCQIHKKEPQVIKEENYFFKLSKYADRIKEAIESGELRIIPKSRENEIVSFIDQGVEDISFSRPRKDLSWGIPVPGDDTQTIYVWADALSNYISAIGYEKETKDFKKYWPADVHSIGKDILRFHSLIWPGILLSIGLGLPKVILVHGFITVDGQKMSKSIGNVIDPFELVNKYGTDSVRYFLLREIPPTDDGDFTYQKFEERYNADLAAGLGNLVSRVLTIAESVKINTKKLDPQFEEVILKTRKEYKEALEDFKFNEVLKIVQDLIGYCDRYIETEKPWEEKNPQVLFNLLVCIAYIAKLINPFMPETSEKIFSQLGVDPLDNKFIVFKIKRGDNLFKRIKAL